MKRPGEVHTCASGREDGDEAERPPRSYPGKDSMAPGIERGRWPVAGALAFGVSLTRCEPGGHSGPPVLTASSLREYGGCPEPACTPIKRFSDTILGLE